jgi:hypothetical protein
MVKTQPLIEHTGPIVALMIIILFMMFYYLFDAAIATSITSGIISLAILILFLRNTASDRTDAHSKIRNEENYYMAPADAQMGGMIDLEIADLAVVNAVKLQTDAEDLVDCFPEENKYKGAIDPNIVGCGPNNSNNLYSVWEETPKKVVEPLSTGIHKMCRLLHRDELMANEVTSRLDHWPDMADHIFDPPLPS